MGARNATSIREPSPGSAHNDAKGACRSGRSGKSAGTSSHTAHAAHPTSSSSTASSVGRASEISCAQAMAVRSGSTGTLVRCAPSSDRRAHPTSAAPVRRDSATASAASSRLDGRAQARRASFTAAATSGASTKPWRCQPGAVPTPDGSTSSNDKASPVPVSVMCRFIQYRSPMGVTFRRRPRMSPEPTHRPTSAGQPSGHSTASFSWCGCEREVLRIRLREPPPQPKRRRVRPGEKSRRSSRDGAGEGIHSTRDAKSLTGALMPCRKAADFPARSLTQRRAPSGAACGR